MRESAYGMPRARGKADWHPYISVGLRFEPTIRFCADSTRRLWSPNLGFRAAPDAPAADASKKPAAAKPAAKTAKLKADAKPAGKGP